MLVKTFPPAARVAGAAAFSPPVCSTRGGECGNGLTAPCGNWPAVRTELLDKLRRLTYD